jgi:hypothetical protein
MIEMRKIVMEKYDQVSSTILHYIEKYTTYTALELQTLKQSSLMKKSDSNNNQKPEFYINAITKDIKFGIYGNVIGKIAMHKHIDFTGTLGCKIPRQYANQQIVMRCLWTSFDYVTGEDYYPDLVVGGIAEFKLFSYPEGEKKVMSK